MAGPDSKVQASGSAGTQGASASVQAPQATPAADPKKSEASNPDDKKTFQLHPFAGIDYQYYDAGKGTDGLFSSGFGALSDQTLTSVCAGFTTNVNANDVRFEFGPEFCFGALRGGPQTNESAINNLGIGPRIVLDWNRAYGFSHLRLLGRLDAAYNIGYAWGETTANPSIRKYEQDALSHKLRGALELIGWNFDNGEAGLNINGGAYIADGDRINNTGMLLGLGAELRLGSHSKVQKVSEPECREMVSDITGNRLELLAAMQKAEEMQVTMTAFRGYLENLPKNPFNQANVRKALVLGNVALQIDAKTDLEPGKIQEAAREANRAEDMLKATTVLVEKTGLPAEQVQAMVADAEKRYPADYNKFWDLPDGSPISADAEAMTKPVSGEPCDADAAKINRAIWSALDKANDRIAALEQQIRRATHLAGLFLGDDIVAKVPKPFTLRFDTPMYDSARPKVGKDMDELKAWAEKHKGNPAAMDDPELMKILNRGDRNKAGQRTKMFAIPDFEVKKLYNLAQFLLGAEKLEGQVKLEEALTKAGVIKAKEEKGANKEIGPDTDLELGKTIKVTFVGFTDGMGDAKANQELSQRRAEAIKYILIGFGLPEERVAAVGMGMENQMVPEPKGGNANDPSRIKNRRVELYLEGEDPSTKAPPKVGTGGNEGEIYDPKEGTPPEDGSKSAAKPGDKKAAAEPAKPQPKAGEKRAPKNPFAIEQGEQ